jgi:hypothetical protein
MALEAATARKLIGGCLHRTGGQGVQRDSRLELEGG